jgi:predicted dehydrogenase
MATLGVGIIGAGRVSGSHIRATQATDGARLVAIADVAQERVDAVVGKTGCAGYADYRKLLERDDIQIVMIGLPHWLHEEVALAAAAAGKHIFLEKPMANTLDECDRIDAAVRRAGVQLMVGHNQHFMAPNMEARRILHSGELGQIVFATDTWYKAFGLAGRPAWFLDRAQGGGMWQMNGAHMVDRMRWIIDSPIIAVKAWIGNPLIGQQADDSSIAMLQFANGVHCTIMHAGYEQGVEQFKGEVLATGGMIKFAPFPPDRGLWISRNGAYEPLPCEQPGGKDPFTLELEAFVDCIERGTESPVSGQWSRDIVEVLLACEESSRTGAEVRIASQVATAAD